MTSGCRRAAGWLVPLLLGAILALPAAVRADDVNDEVRAAYDLATKLLRQGDRASLEKALGAVDARKDEALDSVDYWELYARLWVGLKKSETELWDVVVKQRQDAAPKSPVFCLVRARLEKDPEARGALIDAALERNPASIRARTAKANHLLETGEEDAAWELLEAIVEDDPYAEGALIALAKLALSDGLPAESIEHLDKALEKHRSANLHYLRALAFKRWALNEESALQKALDAATQALGMDPTPEHIELYDQLLKETGDAATAAKALRHHFERTRLPLLGALLADSAFRAGDYEATVLGLSASESNDPGHLKAYAVAHARLGHVDEARKAAAKVRAVDSQGVLFAGQIDLLTGDAAGVKQRLGALADDDARRLRARAHAWLGEPDAIAALVGKDAASGTRDGEDLFIAWLQAQIVKRMGPEFAEAVRKKLLDARFAAGREVVPQAAVDRTELGPAKTAGWTGRAVTYVRASCGQFFRTATDDGTATTGWHFEGGTISMVQEIAATSDCDGDKQHTFTFNKSEMKPSEDGSISFGAGANLGDFGPAQKAFSAGCAAALAGKLEPARESFAKAFKIEPAWYRASLFRAVLGAIGPSEEKRDAAKDAGKALEAWPDDFEARQMVVFLRAWAGDVGLEGEIEALTKREAAYTERDLANL